LPGLKANRFLQLDVISAIFSFYRSDMDDNNVFYGPMGRVMFVEFGGNVPSKSNDFIKLAALQVLAFVCQFALVSNGE